MYLSISSTYICISSHMSGLEMLMKRHCESENRYLEQLPLRKDIEQVNDVMHYVWFIQTRHRTPHTTKLPIIHSRTTNLDPPADSNSGYNNLTPNLKKHSDKISKKTNITPSLKLGKRQKQTPNKSVKIPHFSLPDNFRHSLTPPHTTTLTTSFEDTFNRIQNFPLPLPLPDCVSSDLLKPDRDAGSCYDPYKDFPVEFENFESMVEWNNLNF